MGTVETSYDDSVRRCRNALCGAVIEIPAGTVERRARQYCSPACRQAVYHAKRVAAAADALAAQQARAQEHAARADALEAAAKTSHDDSNDRAGLAEELRLERIATGELRRKLDRAEAQLARRGGSGPDTELLYRLRQVAGMLDALINPPTRARQPDYLPALIRLGDVLNPALESGGIDPLDTDAARERYWARRNAAARAKDTREEMRRQRKSYGLDTYRPLLPEDLALEAVPDASQPGRWKVSAGHRGLYGLVSSEDLVIQELGRVETGPGGFVAYLDDGYNSLQPPPRVEREGRGPASVEEGRDWIADAARARRAWRDAQVKEKLTIADAPADERAVHWGRHQIGTLRRHGKQWAAYLPDGRALAREQWKTSDGELSKYEITIPVVLTVDSEREPEYQPFESVLAHRLRDYVAVHPPGPWAPVRASVDWSFQDEGPLEPSTFGD